MTEDDLMGLFFSFIICFNIGGQLFKVWLLALSVNNFSRCENVACFLVSATICRKKQIGLMSSADGENLKNDKLSCQKTSSKQFTGTSRFLKWTEKLWFFVSLLYCSLGGALVEFMYLFLSHLS